MTITMWRLCVSLLFLELQTVEGVQILQCKDSLVEVPADESLTLNCTPKTQSMEWRLSSATRSDLLAKLIDEQWVVNDTYHGVFHANSFGNGISLTINTSNITDLSLVYGTVICQDVTQSPLTSSNCGLNYVYKPNTSDISCTAANDPGGVNLSCTINNTYSSRGIYKCQAIRQDNQEELNPVDMETCNAGGIKVSGKCVIRQQLTEKAGNYSYSVKISPGGSVVEAKRSDGGTETKPFCTPSTSVASQAAIYNVLTVWLVAALVLL